MVGPAQAKDILRTTARDVTRGRCAVSTGHHKAVPGADLATGHGIADATQATLLAKTRSGAPPAAAPAPPLATSGTAAGNGGQGMEELLLSLAMAQGDEL